MIAFLRRIWVWQEVADWRSWITHTAIALLAAALLTPLIGWTAACVAVVFFYLMREAEQAVHTAFVAGKQPWLDRAMDVLAPALGLGLISWLL
jgi:hypothetical protein